MRTRNVSLPGRIAILAMLLTTLSTPAAHADGQPLPGPSDSLLFVRHITIGRQACDSCAGQVCPGEPAELTVSGIIPAGCVQFLGLQLMPMIGLFPVVAADFVVDTCRAACPDLLMPFSGAVTLPARAPGQYTLMLEERVRTCPDTSVIARVGTRTLTYDVLPACGTEPPLDSLARTLTALRIVPERLCAGDSATLLLVKHCFPPCVHLTGLAMDPARGFLASVEWRPRCLEFFCQPETLALGLGRFAAGSYTLNVLTDVHVLREAGADTTITYRTDLTFEVPRNCDTTQIGCVESPLPPYGTPIPECSVRVPPGGRGEVTLPVKSSVSTPGIAGVEGVVRTSPPFRIVDLQYAGAAAGVHLSWRQDGAESHFVLFGSTPDVVPPGTSDLLRVTVTADSLLAVAVSPSDVYSVGLSGRISLASGPNGEAVPLCPELYRSIPPQLRLCWAFPAGGCDVNGDGHLDVRDLVRMAGCLGRAAGDTSSRAACYDCDGDSTFGIPDLFCCAREILRGPGISHDSTHVQPGLSVSLDPLVHDGDAIRVLLRVRGASGLGAALLRVRYPADRWQLSPTAHADPRAPAGWLPLTDASEAGLLRVGALRLAEVAADELVVELRAVPIAGAEQSGTLSVEGADLTSPTGAALAPAGALPSASLSVAGPVTVVELAPPRPNPFTLSTTFAIGLPAESDVDLTVHDLAGRRVTTLAHGRLGAGRREFTWDGAGARDGVYFVRLTVNGRVLSTRVALLKGGQ
jgi:hypothetical protein